MNQLVGLDIDGNNIEINLNEKTWNGLIWLRIRSNTWFMWTVKTGDSLIGWARLVTKNAFKTRAKGS